jgi:peptidoglycan glycosyltransferase
MTPQVVREVTDFASRPVREFPATPLTLPGSSGPQTLSPETAATLQDMMVAVVGNGTGAAAAIPGIEVAGKTGTAQTGEGRAPTVWFVGFAPADDPQVAVAVVIENGGGVGNEATGGRLAAPIARAVMQAALRDASG